MKNDSTQPPSLEHVCSIDRADWEFGTGVRLVTLLIRERYGSSPPSITTLIDEKNGTVEVWARKRRKGVDAPLSSVASLSGERRGREPAKHPRGT